MPTLVPTAEFPPPPFAPQGSPESSDEPWFDIDELIARSTVSDLASEDSEGMAFAESPALGSLTGAACRELSEYLARTCPPCEGELTLVSTATDLPGASDVAITLALSLQQGQGAVALRLAPPWSWARRRLQLETLLGGDTLQKRPYNVATPPSLRVWAPAAGVRTHDPFRGMSNLPANVVLEVHPSLLLDNVLLHEWMSHVWNESAHSSLKVWLVADAQHARRLFHWCNGEHVVQPTAASQRDMRWTFQEGKLGADELIFPGTALINNEATDNRVAR